MRSYLIAIGLVVCFLTSVAQDSTSFTLKAAQEYAVKNSYNTRIAQQDVVKSKKRVNEITAIGLPQVSGNVSYQNFLKLPVTVVPAEFFGGEAGSFEAVSFGTDQNMTADITGNQLIFDGSYIVGLQAARTYLELSKNSLIKSEIEIRQQVAQAYHMVLAAEKNEEILLKNLETIEGIYTETKALYESGFLEEQDADQVKLTKMNLQTTINKAKRQVKIAYNLLKFQMGIPIEKTITLSEDIETLVNENNKPEYLDTEFALQNHIDYKIALTGVRAGELTLKNERAAYLPKLSGFFTHQQQSPSNEFNYFGDAKWYPSTFWGLNLEVPIFSSLMKHNKVQQAKVDLDIANIQRTQMEENLKLQVDNARANYAYVLDEYHSAQENLTLANSIKEKTNTKYKEGLASSLELAQAENQHLAAQGNYIQSLLNVLNGKTELDKALNNY
jgi:outer membrane protein TolC